MTSGDKWVTPASFSGVTVTRTIVVPVECLSDLDGALYELADPDNWETQGGETVDDTVTKMNDMIDAFLVS